MGGEHKRASERRLDHLRALRSEHSMERRPATEPDTGDDAVPTNAEAVAVPPPVPPPPMAQQAATRPQPDTVDIAQVKYEMELADHRQTMARLLTEKDQTIAALRELVTELRSQLERERAHPAPQPRPEPETKRTPPDAPRHLFDLTDD